VVEPPASADSGPRLSDGRATRSLTRKPTPTEYHAASYHQPSVLSAPHNQPKKGSVKVEPTKEDYLDRPEHNRRAGRADTGRVMRDDSGRRPPVARGTAFSFYNRETGPRGATRSTKCPHFIGSVRCSTYAFDPGPRGVSGRDGAKPSRQPEPGRQVATGAGRRRAERGSAPVSPRPCRILPPLHEAAPIQRSAARFRGGRRCPAGGCPDGTGRGVLAGGCQSPGCEGGVTYARPNLTLLG